MKTVMEQLDYKKGCKEELENAYEKALKNPDFYELVSKLNVPKKELLKYTSRLEECLIEYGHCKNCKSILGCSNKITGFAYLPCSNENQLSFEYQACRYHCLLERKNKFQKNIELFDIPKELKNASMKDIDTKDKNRYPAIKWIQNFLTTYEKNKHQKGLYLYGNFGSGKTYFIAAMFSELARHNVHSVMVFWPDFLRDLKASFGIDFKEKYEFVRSAPLLLIDDIGAEVTTEWGRDEIFCPLVQYRMDQKLPTFFTSNLDLKLLEEHFSCSKKGIDSVKASRIISRIEQLTDQIEMVSKNRRK